MGYKDKYQARAKAKTGTDHSSGIEAQPKESMALSRTNFIYMAIAGAMIVVGFLLMLGPSSTPDNFEPDIFSTRRIVIGPLITFLGFLGMAIAIMVSPRKQKNAE